MNSLQEWWKKNPILASGGVLIVCVLSYFLFFSSGTPTLDLRVEKTGAWRSQRVKVTNIGQSPIAIQRADINGKEVKVTKAKDLWEETNPHIPCPWSDTEFVGTLQMGESTLVSNGPMVLVAPIVSPCDADIIEVTIYTDRGSATYSWK